jgi:hypothetical protein
MKPHPEHRFHTLEEGNPYCEAYDDRMLAQIATNKHGMWSAEDSAIALDVLAWRLEDPRSK